MKLNFILVYEKILRTPTLIQQEIASQLVVGNCLIVYFSIWSLRENIIRFLFFGLVKSIFDWCHGVWIFSHSAMQTLPGIKWFAPKV